MPVIECLQHLINKAIGKVSFRMRIDWLMLSREKKKQNQKQTNTKKVEFEVYVMFAND